MKAGYARRMQKLSTRARTIGFRISTAMHQGYLLALVLALVLASASMGGSGGNGGSGAASASGEDSESELESSVSSSPALIEEMRKANECAGKSALRQMQCSVLYFFSLPLKTSIYALVKWRSPTRTPNWTGQVLTLASTYVCTTSPPAGRCQTLFFPSVLTFIWHMVQKCKRDITHGVDLHIAKKKHRSEALEHASFPMHRDVP